MMITMVLLLIIIMIIIIAAPADGAQAVLLRAGVTVKRGPEGRLENLNRMIITIVMIMIIYVCVQKNNNYRT